MKVRVLLRALAGAGCRSIWAVGSHQKWSTPAGRIFPVVVNHKGADASRDVLATARRVFRAEGLDASVLR